MNALVTGVAGFIGSHLAEELLDQGAKVVGLDCFTDYYPRAVKDSNLAAVKNRSGFTFVESSLQSADLPSLVRRATHIFHLAAQAGVRKSWGGDFRAYTTNNIDATQALLEACAGISIERFVFASSSSVYGDSVPLPMREDALPQPRSPYGVTKLAAEHLCQLYHENLGVPAVSLRYFTVYGPRQRPDMGFYRFVLAVLSGAPITVYGDGEQTRDFTFVTDAVAATIAAGRKGIPGRVYNIGGGSRVTVNHAIELLGRLSGRRVDVRHEPDQKGDMRHTYADTALARREISYAPRVSLEEGLDAEYRWLATARSLA